MCWPILDRSCSATIFNGEYLHQKCAKKKTAIKPWLMDNKVVVGVGICMPANHCLRGIIRMAGVINVAGGV
ncbi:hypothetical protein ACNKHR_13375 [Shigella flexneri]